MPGKVGSNVWGARVVAEGGGKGVEEVHYIACCVAATAGNGKYLNLIHSVHIRNTQFDSCWTGVCQVMGPLWCMPHNDHNTGGKLKMLKLSCS